ncbi:MAG TPA: hypothetical protein VKE69_11455 [Planctomycetota bacterium]|nr:hypothetical protein [Planctomycetota bacterium]
MDKLQDTSLTRSVQRRLAPVKVAIRMLRDEIEIGDGRISLDRALVDGLATTLEMVVDDIEEHVGIPKTTTVAVTNGDRRNVSVLAADKPPLQRLS